MVARVTAALEDSDPLSAAQALDALLDDLSNWYVRRSRRRYWKSEHDADKHTAYATLYFVFVRLVRLLAPFIPFITEAIYQNLVVSVRPEAYPSVHNTAWPPHPQPLPLRQAPDLLGGGEGRSSPLFGERSRAFSAGGEVESLLSQMALARQIASLGLSARNLAGLKVRQPLARVLVYAGGKHALSPELVEIASLMKRRIDSIHRKPSWHL